MYISIYIYICDACHATTGRTTLWKKGYAQLTGGEVSIYLFIYLSIYLDLNLDIYAHTHTHKHTHTHTHIYIYFLR